MGTQRKITRILKNSISICHSICHKCKEGCENEFALFVETESDLYLPNLTEYISFDKGEEKNIINLEQCAELLQVLKTRIKNVEIYYNPYTTKLEGEIEGAKIFNIITQEEV